MGTTESACYNEFNVMSTIDWAKIRSNFKALSDGRVYLDAGELGIQPNQVIKAKADWETMVNDLGPGSSAVSTLFLEGFSTELISNGHRYEYLNGWKGVETLRHEIAMEIGATQNEITFTRNTTEAMWTVIESLPNSASKTLVFSDVEHDAAYVNAYYAHVYKGLKSIKVNLVDILNDDRFSELCVERIVKAVDNKTRLVVMSQIIYSCGLELPVAAITSACKQKNPDVLILVDGAHTFGQTPINVSEIKSDFYITAGHKWLCGPRGSGIMYCSEAVRKQERLNIRPTGMCFAPLLYEPRATEIVGTDNPRFERYKLGFERLIEFGTIEESVLIGLNEALRFYKMIGVEQIHNRIGDLTTQLRCSLKELPGIELIPLHTVHNGCGIVSFTRKDKGIRWTYRDACNIVDSLDREYGIVCRAIPNPVAVRLCVNYYNDEHDLTKLANSLPSLPAIT